MTDPSPKPFAPASERNRDPILAVLRERFAGVRRVLEIGSGTGQHAVHFAAALPHLVWQTSDVAANLPGIRQWLAEAALPNTPAPLAFDVDAEGEWPAERFDAVFSANTLHIMGWRQVEKLFAGLPALLAPRGLLTVYGPFKREGRFSGASDAAFDASLREADPRRGLRDIEAVHALAQAAGLAPVEDRAMPANNRCITWQSIP
jgi:cyclopropane fatty-acyl-phospholipid synthase-like methyltransferase